MSRPPYRQPIPNNPFGSGPVPSNAHSYDTDADTSDFNHAGPGMMGGPGPARPGLRETYTSEGSEKGFLAARYETDAESDNGAPFGSVLPYRRPRSVRGSLLIGAGLFDSQGALRDFERKPDGPSQRGFRAWRFRQWCFESVPFRASSLLLPLTLSRPTQHPTVSISTATTSAPKTRTRVCANSTRPGRRTRRSRSRKRRSKTSSSTWPTSLASNGTRCVTCTTI